MLSSVLVMALLVFAATAALLLASAGTQARASRSHRAAQALNLAEAGIARAAAEMSLQGLTYRGEAGTALGRGTFDVRVTPDGAWTATILARGVAPMPEMAPVVREIQVRAELRRVGDGFTVALSRWRWVEADE
jgi:hypothetical protein